MGLESLANMRSAVRYNIGNPGTTAVTNTQVDRWINDSYRQVAGPNVFKHRELQEPQTSIVLVQGQVTYTITAPSAGTIWTLLNVIHYETTTDPPPVGTARRKVHRGFVEQFDQILQPTGRPNEFDVWNNLLELDRIPGAAEAGQILRFRAYIEPPPLLASASLGVTLLRPAWDEVIVAGATWRGWQARQRYDRADYWRVEAASLTANVVKQFEIEAEDPDLTMEVAVPQTMRM